MGQQETAQRGRLIWVTGGKGGVGKSTFSRGLLDVLLKAGVTVAAFDGDTDNSQLFRFYQGVGNGVKRIELDIQGGADVLLDVMEAQKAQVVMVDVAAGGSRTLMELENDIGLLSGATELGYDVTVVSVLSRIKDSINLLKAALEMTASFEGSFEVAHVAVKNLYFGEADRFRLFDQSKTKVRLLEAGGVVLEMPELFDDTYELLDQQNLPFAQAVTSPSEVLSRAHRSRVHKWRLGLAQAVRDTDGMLGL